MTIRTKLTLGGALTALAAVVFSLGVAVAQTPTSPPHMTASPPTHAQLHQMIDMMHGEGASERLHDALGEEADALMDQCAAMMAMMGSQRSQSMPDMMQWMIGR